MSIPGIAKLRHRVIIQQLVNTPDGQGGFSESWTTYATRWASVSPKSGREVYFSQQIKPEYSHEIFVRFDSGIKETMRISYDGRIFHIKSIQRVEWEKGFYMQIGADEGVGT